MQVMNMHAVFNRLEPEFVCGAMDVSTLSGEDAAEPKPSSALPLEPLAGSFHSAARVIVTALGFITQSALLRF